MTIDKESLRPAFERSYPAPKCVRWHCQHQTYVLVGPGMESMLLHSQILGRWEGFCAAFESLGEPVALHIGLDGSATPVYRLPGVKT